MSFGRRLTQWIDRQWLGWEGNAGRLVGLRLLWILPFLLAVLVIDLMGADRHSDTGSTILIAGGIGALALLGWSLWRWVRWLGSTRRSERMFRANEKLNG